MEKTVDRNQWILQLRQEGKSLRQIGKEVDLSHIRVRDILKRMLPRPESMERLTPKEQKFVVALVEGKTPTNAVMESHDVNSRESAKALQKTLLKKDDIKLAISEYLQIYGLTRGYRVKMLKKHVDHVDPVVSLKALDQSWKLDGYPVAKNPGIPPEGGTFLDLSSIQVVINIDPGMNVIDVLPEPDEKKKA